MIALRRILSWAAAVLLSSLTVAAVSVGPADAAVAPDHPTAAAPACVILLGEPATPDAVSPVLYQYCGKTRDEARAHLFSPAVKSQLAPDAVTSSDLLMTWFEHIDYGGTWADIYGRYGTCDTAGYRIQPTDWWAHNLSSAAGFAQCNAARFSTIAQNYSESFWLPVRYLGPTLNDNVGTVWVYHA